MPTTAYKHFDEDMDRAWDLLQQAGTLETAGRKQALHRDLRHASLAMAVGAMDAYLCDAYVDCLTSVLKAYTSRKWKGSLPSAYAKQPLPAGIVLDTSRQNRPRWALRMAARAVMERDNMLALSRIPNQFNPILPASHKLWGGIVKDLAFCGYRRLTGQSYAELQRLSGQRLTKASKAVIACFIKRLTETVQLRHDWAHNCGRPKSAVVDLSYRQASARINEVGSFVATLDGHIDTYRLV